MNIGPNEPVNTDSQSVRHVIGCMTGTSLDGIDAALVRITGQGLTMQPELLGHLAVPLGDLAGRIQPLAEGKPQAPLVYMRLAREIGVFHAHACDQLIQRSAEALGDTSVDFITAHGQTIWHAPQDHLSWQLFDPWPIVQHLNLPVCYDLRQADLIAGGEGAPITPIVDPMLYPEADAVVNLGGVANVTLIDRQPVGAHVAVDGQPAIEAGDLFPCNLLIDQVTQQVYPGCRYDADGRFAAAGQADATIFADLPGQLKGKRSLGREDVLPDVIAGLIDPHRERLQPNDLIASAVAMVADQLAEKLKGSQSIVLAGGGALNPTLVTAIEQRLVGKVVTSASLGIPNDAREALAFAVLGALCQDGVPITLPQVTGVSAGLRIAGAWAGIS